MQLKYLGALLEAQESEFKIHALAFSQNSQKIAAATADRQIVLFDDKGEKRDKFSTKPYDADAGKMSYVVTGTAFSPDSTKLAVAQSDCIVYVYKLGENWGEKKAICNKFPQPHPVTSLLWLQTGPIICGLSDGKVRALQIKSNKSQSLYASDSLVVSLASNLKGTGFLSGHVDGSIIRFFVVHDRDNPESQGKVVVHSVPPYALSWTQGHIIAAGCDKRVVVYNLQGKNTKNFDYSKDLNEHEFTVAVTSPSGQAVIVGSFNRLRFFTLNSNISTWEQTSSKEISNIYTITALSWSRDGTKLVCSGLSGAVLLFEFVLKRTIWKDIYEIIFVGPNQILVKTLNGSQKEISVLSEYGGEIEHVKIMGRDNYLVARTNSTLIIVDLVRMLTSEILWNDSGKHEKFYFDYPSVCLIFNAGELSLVEYGENDILASVRTEIANPHLLSVRLNERYHDGNNKKLAYLLDLKTICVIDLITGIPITQISHESKIDWLEMNETAHKLLFRDKKQRLILVDIFTQEKRSIFSGVSFVQWVEGSDVAVAQADSCLAVWYNIELPEHPTVIPIRGDVIDVVRNNGKTEAICIDGQNTLKFELDEGLVEFGTAVNDNDYGRAVLFLESIDNTKESEAMWFHLSNIAVREQNLILAERCAAALGNVATTHFLSKTIDLGIRYAEEHDGDNNCPDVWIRLAILNCDLNTAENVYLEKGDLEGALNMHKKLHKWEEALRLAESRGYQKLHDLKEDYMKHLLQSEQYEKAGQLLEKDGKHEQAIEMYLKSSRLMKIPRLILNHNNLLSDGNLINSVIKKLLKHEHFEGVAEIYEKLEKTDLAMQCYRKGKIFNKAIELARSVNPEQVVELEEEWGDSLVENKQSDAAINHYIEAGCTKKALEAAVSARQWKKAMHIIQVIEDTKSVAKYYDLIANYFASIKDYATAEKMYVSSNMYKEAVVMYGNAGQWEKAQKLASQYLDPDEVADMFVKQAESLESDGKYRDAEKLYLSVDAADLAIAMYKRVEQYDNMVRLVERYHPDLLQTTHLHLGQQLEAQGKHRAAEIHYVAAGEWKAAVNMYRTLSLWEEAYRVAKQNGGATAARQVAFLWASTLPIDSAIKLLNKYGILESCIDYACETFQFDFAFQLAKNLPNQINDVHYKYAMILEDDGKFSEAEAEFIMAEKPKEAVLMYVHSQNWINALRVAESYEPSAVQEVLQAQAAQCFNDKQYSEFEVLLLRAQMPELIVRKYKSENMWVDALRVCRDYLPALYPSLQAEYSSSSFNKNTDISIEALLSRANEWTLAGQHMQAIECLLQVNESIADASIVKRALLRAADTVNKFLFGDEALSIIRLLAPRLVEVGEANVAVQLYLSVDLIKEAIDTLTVAEEWNKARKIAKELGGPYESYVESKYKDRLLQDGNVEQLADVDIIGALDLLAEQGQWARCIEKAKTHSIPVLHKYVALYAAQLLKDGFVQEAINLYSTYGSPAIPQNFNIYNKIAVDTFAMPDLSGPEGYPTWMQLRQILNELNEGIELQSNIATETKMHFKKLLLITHYYATRSACRQVSSMKPVCVKISVALLRYTDIIPADKAFYEAGNDLREEGRVAEAFVFLNHYLDICEAIEEGEVQLVDHSDLGQTDFPSNIPIPDHLHLQNTPHLHDSVREWVLAVSMDQKVDQVLPVDDRNLYESSLQSGEVPCIVTGYPVKNPSITFAKSSYMANKNPWSKLNMAAKMSPDSNIPSVLTFINQLCGPSIN